MAACIEIGVMAHPKHYSSKFLNYLGLVAGMYDELGIGELIDRVVIQNDLDLALLGLRSFALLPKIYPRHIICITYRLLY